MTVMRFPAWPSVWPAAPMLAACLAGCAAFAAPSNTPIQHVIIIMQENRSVDSYFGSGSHIDRVQSVDGNAISSPQPAAAEADEP